MVKRFFKVIENLEIIKESAYITFWNKDRKDVKVLYGECPKLYEDFIAQDGGIRDEEKTEKA